METKSDSSDMLSVSMMVVQSLLMMVGYSVLRLVAMMASYLAAQMAQKMEIFVAFVMADNLAAPTVGMMDSSRVVQLVD